MAPPKTEVFRLDGKVALITGAAKGLGAGIAVMLARQGADIAISDKPGVSLTETEQQARAFGHRVLPFEFDVRDTAQWAAQKAAVRNELGVIGILVNNAGINRPAPGLQLTESEWDDHFATNARGGFPAKTTSAGRVRVEMTRTREKFRTSITLIESESSFTTHSSFSFRNRTVTGSSPTGTLILCTIEPICRSYNSTCASGRLHAAKSLESGLRANG